MRAEIIFAWVTLLQSAASRHDPNEMPEGLISSRLEQASRQVGVSSGKRDTSKQQRPKDSKVHTPCKKRACTRAGFLSTGLREEVGRHPARRGLETGPGS